MWSPRAGFNWDVSGDGKQQLRGGVGIFAGRPPYVWISNQYGNTGVDFTRIGAAFNAANRIPFVADPTTSPRPSPARRPGAFTNEIDLVDPDFKYPRSVRGNLGYDRELGFGLVATVEGLYGDPPGHRLPEPELHADRDTQGADGRPIFRRSRRLSDVIFLTNTEGQLLDDERRSGAAVRNRCPCWTIPLREVDSINDGGSDQAARTGTTTSPGIRTRRPSPIDFSPGHRINLTATYECKARRHGVALLQRPVGPALHAPVPQRHQRRHQDGQRPRVRADGESAYLHQRHVSGSAEVHAATTDARAIGQIMPRNACRPLDEPDRLSLRRQPAVPESQLEFTLDMLNLMNLFWHLRDLQLHVFPIRPFRRRVHRRVTNTTWPRSPCRPSNLHATTCGHGGRCRWARGTFLGSRTVSPRQKNRWRPRRVGVSGSPVARFQASLLVDRFDALDRFLEVVLVHLDPDEVEAEPGRGDALLPSPRNGSSTTPARSRPCRRRHCSGHFRRKRRRVRPVAVAALNRLVRDEPRVAAAPQAVAGLGPALDVRRVLIGHADGAAIEPRPAARREVKDELVAVVHEPVAVDRLVVADGDVPVEPAPAPAASRSMAIDLTQ